ncbi:MAG: 6-carboxytetrahydropterin synthase [Fimbriimonadales bacterium]
MSNPTVRLTRRVTFSSGHRYWNQDLTPEQNRGLFGPWASPFNHGHNYVLEVTTKGSVDPVTGMVVNIKRIDDILQERIVKRYDQKSLNDEAPEFASRPPSVENILLTVKDHLAELPAEAELAGLKLEETPLLYGELERVQNPPQSWRMTLTRVYEFAAAHRLDVPSLSHAENLELFGKCNNPMGHGHNYVLEVTVEGEPNPLTGMLADIGTIDTVVEREVVDRYDHKNLNEDIEEFQGKPTTSEIVAQTIWSRLNGKLPAKLSRIRLFETARNVFEIRAEDA